MVIMDETKISEVRCDPKSPSIKATEIKGHQICNPTQCRAHVQLP